MRRIAFTPDGRLIASGGRDRNVYLRDFENSLRYGSAEVLADDSGLQIRSAVI
jgi:hypothetical protein